MKSMWSISWCFLITAKCVTRISFKCFKFLTFSAKNKIAVDWMKRKQLCLSSYLIICAPQIVWVLIRKLILISKFVAISDSGSFFLLSKLQVLDKNGRKLFRDDSTIFHSLSVASDDPTQGCQIFLVTTYQNEKYLTTIHQNMPNYYKIFKMAIKYPKFLVN
jgi:hypothetical protein